MANDYIPRPNARFHTWQNNFVTYVNGHLPDLGLAAGEDIAKTAHYMLRCVSTCADKGPWSETASATIGA